MHEKMTVSIHQRKSSKIRKRLEVQMNSLLYIEAEKTCHFPNMIGYIADIVCNVYKRALIITLTIN